MDWKSVSCAWTYSYSFSQWSYSRSDLCLHLQWHCRLAGEESGSIFTVLIPWRAPSTESTLQACEIWDLLAPGIWNNKNYFVVSCSSNLILSPPSWRFYNSWLLSKVQICWWWLFLICQIKRSSLIKSSITWLRWPMKGSWKSSSIISSLSSQR